MKSLAFLLLSAVTVLADIPITKEEASTIKSLDAREVQDNALALTGKLVRVRFNYRSSTITPGADGSLSGEIRIYRSRNTINEKRNYRWGGVNVSIPAEGADWFTRISTSLEARAPLYVLARVNNSDAGNPRLDLLGREVRTDSKGSRIVW